MKLRIEPEAEAVRSDKMIKRFLLFFLVFFASWVTRLDAQMSGWRQLNGPEGGAIASLLRYGDRIYATTKFGLCYQLAPDRSGWLPLDVPSPAFHILAAHPTEGLWGGDDSGSVYCSYDSGATWSQRGVVQTTGQPVTSLVVVDSEYMYAVCGGSLLRSTDQGWHWTVINSSLPLNYPSIYSVCGGSNRQLFAMTYGYTFRSTDRGLSWQNVYSDNILLLPGQPLLGVSRDTIRISYNDGDSWAIVKTDSIRPAIEILGWMNSNSFVYTDAYHRLFRHTIGGRTELLPLRYSSRITSVAMADTDNMLVGTYTGMVKYRLSENRFVPFNGGLHVQTVQSLAIDGRGQIFGRVGQVFTEWSWPWYWYYIGDGSSDLAVYRSRDDGVTWTPTNSAYSGYFSQPMKVSAQGNLFVGGLNCLYRSPDDGSTWQRLVDTARPNYSVPHTEWITMSPQGPIFACFTTPPPCCYYPWSYPVIRSTDEGNTWSSIPILREGAYPRMVVDKDGLVFCGYDGSHRGVYRSTDQGQTWTQVGLYFTEILSIAADNNANIFAATGKGLYISTNHGDDWALRDSMRVSMLVADPWGGLFAKTFADGRIIYSRDMAQTWTDLSSPGNFPITDLVVDRAGAVYISTIGHGIWKSGTIAAVEDKGPPRPVSARIVGNYPNPFNPSTTIRFTLPEAAGVQLHVYSVLGQEIENIPLGECPAGERQYQWNASRFPSGIYIARITTQSGNGLDHASPPLKLVLIK